MTETQVTTGALTRHEGNGGGGLRAFSPADVDALYRRALLNVHGGERGAWMDETRCLELAEQLRPVMRFAYQVAFVIATALYPPSTDRRDPARARCVDVLQDAGVSRRESYRACEMVDLVAAMPVERVGEPEVEHLVAVVRSDVGRGGWGKVNGWVARKGGFARVTAAAVADYCRRVQEAGREDEQARASQRTQGDPHEPADAVAVEVDDDEAALLEARQAALAEPPALAPPRPRRHMNPSSSGEGPEWRDAMRMEAGLNLVLDELFSLGHGADEDIDAWCEAHDDDDLGAVVLAMMRKMGRPPEKIAPYLTCRRAPLVHALKGLARMTRERAGLPA